MNTLPNQPKPADFELLSFKKTYLVKGQEAVVWSWLNDPKTFTDNQLWPFRVEFLREPQHLTDFQTGVWNVHHGPLMSFAGVIGEINPHYRDLQYHYGSYFLSFRLIRPARLQFTTSQEGENCTVEMQLDSYVKPWIKTIWSRMLGVFWSGFEGTLKKGLAKRAAKL